MSELEKCLKLYQIYLKGGSIPQQSDDKQPSKVQQIITGWIMLKQIALQPNLLFQLINECPSKPLTLCMILSEFGSKCTAFTESTVGELVSKGARYPIEYLIRHTGQRLSASTLKELYKLGRQSVMVQIAMLDRPIIMDLDATLKQNVRQFQNLSSLSRVQLAHLLAAQMQFPISQALQKRLNFIAQVRSSHALIKDISVHSRVKFSSQLYQVLSAFFYKFSYSRNIVIGLFETLHYATYSSLSVDILQLFKFCHDLYSCALYEVSVAEQPIYIEVVMLRRELAAYFIKQYLFTTGEAQKLLVAQFIIKEYLEPFVDTLSKPGSSVNMRQSLIIGFCFDQLAHLVIDLGQSAFVLHSSYVTLLKIFDLMASQKLQFNQVIGSTFSLSLTLSFAWCVRQFLLQIPSLSRDSILCFVGKLQSSQVNEELLFSSIVVASTLPVLDHMHVDYDWIGCVVQVALQLLRQSFKSSDQFLTADSAQRLDQQQKLEYLKRASLQSHCGWMLLSAAASFGGEQFLQLHFQQVLLHLKNSCIKVNKDGVQINNKPSALSNEGWIWVAVSREAALNTMLLLLKSDGFNRLITIEVCKKFTTLVQQSLVTLHNIPKPCEKLLFQRQTFIPNVYSYADVMHGSGSSSSATIINLSSQNVLQNPFILSGNMGNITNAKRLAYECFAILHRSLASDSIGAVFFITRSVMDYITSDTYLVLPQSNDVSRISQHYSTNDQKGSNYVVSAGPSTIKIVPLPCLNDTQEWCGADSRTFMNDLCMTSMVSSLVHDMYRRNKADNVVIQNDQRRPSMAYMNQQSGVNRHIQAFEGVADHSLGLGPKECLDTAAVPWTWCSLEHDMWLMFRLRQQSPRGQKNATDSPLPSLEGEATVYQPRVIPVQISVTDSAVQVFAALFVEAEPAYQEVLIDQILKTVNVHRAHLALAQSSSASTVGISFDELKQTINCRITKVHVNGLAALILAFEKARQTGRKFLASKKIGSQIQEFCMACLGSSFAPVRMLASVCLANLAKASASSPGYEIQYQQELLKTVTDLAVNSSKDACLRAGACYAMASVLLIQGSMSTQTGVLRNTLKVLQPLCLDSNPIVHSWSLFALSRLLDVYSINLLASLGAKEVNQVVLETCLYVLSSDSHKPFWGAEKQRLLQSQAGGDSTVFMPAALLCPYRSVLRILHAVLGAYGPELGFDSGLTAGSSAVLLIQIIQHELQTQTSLLHAHALDDTSVLPLLHQLKLGLLPQNFSVQAPKGSPMSQLTSVSPQQFIEVEVLRCMYQFVTFGVFQLFDSKVLLSRVQLLLLPSPMLAVPLSVIRAAIKILWHSIVAGWQVIGGTGQAVMLLGRAFPEQLLYLCQFVNLQKQVVNSCYSGYMEDRLTIEGFATRSVSEDVMEILQVIYEADLQRGAFNRWFEICNSIVSRTAQESLSDANEVAESPVQAQEEIVDLSQEDLDNKSDNGDKDANDVDIDIPDDVEQQNGDTGSHKRVDSPTIKLQPINEEPLSASVLVQFNEEDLVRFKDVSVRYWIALTPLANSKLQAFVINILLKVIEHVEVQRQLVNVPRIIAIQADIAVARTLKSKLKALRPDQVPLYVEDSLPLVLFVSDLIRFAINAGTSGSVDFVRVSGLRLLKELLILFGQVYDPEFPDVFLLEQYQAQINAGLTLSFADPFKEGQLLPVEVFLETQVASLSVCKVYMCSGISSSASGLSRIIKVLNNLYDLRFGANAAVRSPQHALCFMRIQFQAIIAEILIQCRSMQANKVQPFVLELIVPFVAKLVPHWLSFLKESFRVKHVSDTGLLESPANPPQVQSVMDSSSYSNSSQLDSSYMESTKSLMFHCYLDCWSTIAQALSIEISAPLSTHQSLIEHSSRSGAPEYFYTLFAQCVEILISWTKQRCSKVRCLAAIKLLTALFSQSLVADLKEWFEKEMFHELLYVLITVALYDINIPDSDCQVAILLIGWSQDFVGGSGQQYLNDQWKVEAPLLLGMIKTIVDSSLKRSASVQGTLSLVQAGSNFYKAIASYQ